MNKQSKQRTGGMIAIAIINFLFGGGGILAALFGLVFASSLMTNPMMTLGGKGTQLGIVILATALLSLPSSGAAIVSGIGILKLASWGRTWTLVYAILGILTTLISLPLTAAIEKINTEASPSNPVLTIIVGCVYPGILFWLINTRKWKERFSDNSVQEA